MRRKDDGQCPGTRPTERQGAGCSVGAGIYVGFGRVPSLSAQDVNCQSRLVFLSQGFTKSHLSTRVRELPPHDRTPTGVVDYKASWIVDDHCLGTANTG